MNGKQLLNNNHRYCRPSGRCWWGWGWGWREGQRPPRSGRRGQAGAGFVDGAARAPLFTQRSCPCRCCLEPRTQSHWADRRQRWACVASFLSSDQDGISTLGKAHNNYMRSSLLWDIPNVVFEKAPMFVWLTVALSGPFKEDRLALPLLSTPLSCSQSMWDTHAGVHAEGKWNSGEKYLSNVTATTKLKLADLAFEQSGARGSECGSKRLMQ